MIDHHRKGITSLSFSIVDNAKLSFEPVPASLILPTPSRTGQWSNSTTHIVHLLLAASKLHLIDRSITPVPMFQPVGSHYDDPTPIEWRKPKPHQYLESPRPRSPSPRTRSPGVRSILKCRPFETSSREPFPVESYIERSYPTYDSYVPLPRPKTRLPRSSYGSSYGSMSPSMGYDREVARRVGYDSWSTTKRYETGYDSVEIITPRPPPPRPYTAITREPPRYRNNWTDESPRRLSDYDDVDLELLAYAKDRMRERDLLYRYGL
jgi:hypothetical protein